MIRDEEPTFVSLAVEVCSEEDLIELSQQFHTMSRAFALRGLNTNVTISKSEEEL